MKKGRDTKNQVGFRGTPDERFWKKVTKTDSCWIWTAGTLSNGYGSFRIEPGKHMLSHRYSWLKLRGELNPYLVLDHICNIPRCVNPDHLQQITQGENSRRGIMAKLERDTTCRSGHTYSEENTYYLPKSMYARHCRKCNAENSRRYRAKKKNIP